MYAVNDLSDAIDVTREFLTPIHAGTWIKLAVIVLFVTGFGFGVPTIPTGDVSFDEDPFADETIDEEFGEEIPIDDLIVLAIVVIAAAFVLWLVFTFVGAIMEFVLISALRTGDVAIRRAGRANFRRAMSLFAFTVLLALIVLGTVAAIAYATVYPIDSLDELTVSAVGTVAIAGVVLGLLYGVVMRLTTDFVVPVMLLEECGIRAGWSRFFGALKSRPGEYVVYLVLATIIQWVASIAIGILAVITFIVLLIPAVILFVIALFLGPLAIPLLVLLVVGLVVAMLLVYSLYQMPVIVYIRYYALLVLGDTDDDLDLIPGQREWVRSADDWDQDPMGERDDEWRDPDDDTPGANGFDSGQFDGTDRSSDDEPTDDGYGWETTDETDDSTSGHGWEPTDDTAEDDDGSDAADDASRELASDWREETGEQNDVETGRDIEGLRDTEETQDIGVDGRRPTPEERESAADGRESDGEGWDAAYDGRDLTGEDADHDRSWVPDSGHGWGNATDPGDVDGGRSDDDPVDRRPRNEEDGASSDRSIWDRDEADRDRDPWGSDGRGADRDHRTSGEADEDWDTWTPESPADDRTSRSGDGPASDRPPGDEDAEDEEDEERGWRYRDDS